MESRVSADGRRIFVVGTLSSPDQDATKVDFGVAAWDAITGAQLWSATYNGPDNLADYSNALALSPDGTRVFVNGFSRAPGSLQPTVRVVVAYDAATGAQLWASRFQGPRQLWDNNNLGSIVTSPDGKQVYATGQGTGATGFAPDFVTIAYDAATGAQVWLARYDDAVHDTDGQPAIFASPDGTGVYVAGYCGSGEGEFNYCAVAYDATTGAQRWATQYGSPNNGDDHTDRAALSADGSKLFVTGTITPPGAAAGNGYDFETVAFDTRTGDLLWVTTWDGPQHDEELAWNVEGSPDGSLVFVEGGTYDGSEGMDFVTIAYDAATGSQMWVSQYQGKSSHGLNAMAVSPGGELVYVSGNGGAGPASVNGPNDTTIAYDTATGAQVWVANYAPGLATNPAVVSRDGSFLYIVGETAKLDFLVVAYHVTTPPSASLSTEQTGARTINFSMTSADSDGAISAWSLDVDGDGRAEYQGTGAPPATLSHTYATLGTFEPTLTVSDNDGAIDLQTATVLLAPPVASLSPSQIVFGAQRTDTPSALQTVTLRNSAAGPLSISGASIGGANASDFAVSEDSCSGTQLAAAATCAVAVRFAPATIGPKQATLSIFDDAPDSPQTMSFSGIGIAPEVGASPASIVFGDQPVGTLSNATTVTISNTGSADASIGAATLTGASPGNFAIQGDSCSGAHIAVGASCTIQIDFAPIATGIQTATLSLPTDAGTTVVVLKGTGIKPVLNVDPLSVSFPTQTVGATSVSQTVTVKNPGNDPLVIGSLFVSGATPDDFSLAADACSGHTLAMGQECTTSVAFTPKGSGQRSASLSIPSNASGDPTIARLAGVGAGAPLSLTPSALQFGDQPADSSSPARLLSVRNSGAVSLSVSSIYFSGADTDAFRPSEDRCTGATLSPGEVCTLRVAFAPRGVGERRAWVSVSTPAGQSSVTLSGVGTSPALSSQATRMEFPVTRVGATTAAQSVRITNTGNAETDELVTSVDEPHEQDFQITDDSCSGAHLSPGASCVVFVRFAPANSGTRVGSLSIAGTAVSVTLDLRGVGDGAAPVSKFTTRDGAIIVGGTQFINGTLRDDFAGVDSATMTVTSITGDSVPFYVSLSCARGSTFCRWQADAPLVPGAYTLNVRGVDVVGHAESPGATISIIVL